MDCFEGLNGEDCEHLTSFGNCKDVYNVYSAGWEPCEEIYYCAVVRGSTNLAFCNYIWFCNTMRYCDSCVSCEECFGCIGLRHKKYCILNKQYIKEEYEALRNKIIEHMKKTDQWGKFFPPALSPFAYNETPAQVFMPLAKEEVLKRGWRWREEDKKEYRPATLAEISDSLKEVSDNITKEILACAACRKNYRIIMQELKFYRRMNLPIPRLCSECRNQNRISEDNPRQVFSRRCSNCQETLKSPYAAERPETVYCKKCYLETVH